MTTYDLLVVAGELDLARLKSGLTMLASVPSAMVDVAEHGVMERDWGAAVLCTYEPVSGDVSWLLDVYFADAIPAPPKVAQVAAHLAGSLGIPVLYPDDIAFPGAYWLVAPDGSPTRARIEEVEDDERTTIVIEAVERPIPALPHLRVEAQPEVIREHRMPTPITDDFKAWLEADSSLPDSPGDAAWLGRTRLGAWESLTARMAAGWPPDGWYPVEYFREDLSTRDELATAADRLPAAAAQRFAAALARVDDAFRAGTREVADPDEAVSEDRGWWWRRLPDPEPWRRAPAQT